MLHRTEQNQTLKKKKQIAKKIQESHKLRKKAKSF